MCEPKTWQALILGLACACEPGPAPPPSAPATVVPVASATAAPLSVEPAPPLPVATDDAPASAPEDDLLNPAPSSSPASAPFDRGRAAAGLGSVDLRPCASISGQRGPGRVRISFHAPDGRAQAVILDPPYAGTAVGSCIVERYRRVTVPPFMGADVTVGKSFVIQ